VLRPSVHLEEVEIKSGVLRELRVLRERELEPSTNHMFHFLAEVAASELQAPKLKILQEAKEKGAAAMSALRKLEELSRREQPPAQQVHVVDINFAARKWEMPEMPSTSRGALLSFVETIKAREATTPTCAPVGGPRDWQKEHGVTI